MGSPCKPSIALTNAHSGYHTGVGAATAIQAMAQSPYQTQLARPGVYEEEEEILFEDRLEIDS